MKSLLVLGNALNICKLLISKVPAFRSGKTLQAQKVNLVDGEGRAQRVERC